MISAAWKWTVAAGEPVGLLYRRRAADGSVRPLAGEVLALTLYDSSRQMRASGVGVIEQDAEGDLQRLMLPAGTSETLWGARAIAWELARLLPGGERQRLFGGAFEVTASAAETAGTAPIAGEPALPFLEDVEGSRSAREIVTRGPPGPAPWEALGQTLEAWRAALAESARTTFVQADEPDAPGAWLWIKPLGDGTFDLIVEDGL